MNTLLRQLLSLQKKHHLCLALLLIAWPVGAQGIRAAVDVRLSMLCNQSESSVLPTPVAETSLLAQASFVSAWNLLPWFSGSADLYIGDNFFLTAQVGGGFIKYGRAAVLTTQLISIVVSNDLDQQVRLADEMFAYTLGGGLVLPLPGDYALQLKAGYDTLIDNGSYHYFASPLVLFNKARVPSVYAGIEFSKTINAIDWGLEYTLALGRPVITVTDNIDDQKVVYRVGILANTFTLSGKYAFTDNFHMSASASYSHAKNRCVGFASIFDGDVFVTEVQNLVILMDQKFYISASLGYAF